MYSRRRDFLATGLAAGAALAFGPAFWRHALAATPAVIGPGPYGPLSEPDANGLRLPEGFSSRLVARGGEPVAPSSYVWHPASDGAATFGGSEGGWILVSNSEITGSGGASAIHFSADGAVLDADRILAGTSRNCAGGATPWGTWLSCEEVDGGRVWECDPLARLVDGRIEPAPIERPAMGIFKHEAAAVDRHVRCVYLTEDLIDGGLYRYTPKRWPRLDAGLLEIARVAKGGAVEWVEVPDPSAARERTRRQVPGSTGFARGEGLWLDDHTLYVSTTADHRVHAYDTRRERMRVVYDGLASASAPLLRVDQLTGSRGGEVFVCEDIATEEIDIGVIAPDRSVSKFLSVTGPRHRGSELTGVTFDPSGSRMYFASQRAFPESDSLPGPGAIYEVTGPFGSAARRRPT